MAQIKIEIIGGSDDPEMIDMILSLTSAVKAKHPGTTVKSVDLDETPMRVTLAVPADAAAAEVVSDEPTPKSGEVVQLPEKAAKGKGKKANGTQKPSTEVEVTREPKELSEAAPAAAALKPAEAREKVNDLVQRLWTSGRPAQDGVKAILDGYNAKGVGKLEDTVIVEALDKFQVLAGQHLA